MEKKLWERREDGEKKIVHSRGWGTNLGPSYLPPVRLESQLYAMEVVLTNKPFSAYR